MRVIVVLLLFFSLVHSGKDLYKDLDCRRGASEAEIKNCYRSQAKKYHPDVQTRKLEKKLSRDLTPEESKKVQDKYIDITNAYEVLKDPKKRNRYDRYGVTDDGKSFPSYSRGSSWSHSSSGNFKNFFNFGGGSGRKNQLFQEIKDLTDDDYDDLKKSNTFVPQRNFQKHSKVIIVFKFKYSRNMFGQRSISRKDLKYINFFERVIKKIKKDYAISKFLKTDSRDHGSDEFFSFYKYQKREFELRIFVNGQDRVYRNLRSLDMGDFLSFLQNFVFKKNLASTIAVFNDLENFNDALDSSGWEDMFVLFTRQFSPSRIESLIAYKMRNYFSFVHVVVNSEILREVREMKYSYSGSLNSKKLPALVRFVRQGDEIEVQSVGKVTKNSLVRTVFKTFKKDVRVISYQKINPIKVYEYCFRFSSCMFVFETSTSSPIVSKLKEWIADSSSDIKVVFFNENFFVSRDVLLKRDVVPEEEFSWSIVLVDETLNRIRVFDEKTLDIPVLEDWIDTGLDSSFVVSDWIDFDIFSLSFLQVPPRFYQTALFKLGLTSVIVILFVKYFGKWIGKCCCGYVKLGKKHWCLCCCCIIFSVIVLFLVALIYESSKRFDWNSFKYTYNRKY